MNINSAAALIHRGDLAKRHWRPWPPPSWGASARPRGRVYSGAWSRFQAWATRRESRRFPHDPVTVAAYLVHRDALGLSFSSLAMDCKAISFFHRRTGLPTPTVSEGVKMTLAGVREPCRQARKGRAEAGPGGSWKKG